MKNFLCICALLVGCGGDDGGGGGVSGSKKLSKLTAAEAQAACRDLAADYPPRTVDCGGGVTFEIGVDDAECDTAEPADATCTATVSQARACFTDQYELSDDEICNSETAPASCAALEGC